MRIWRLGVSIVVLSFAFAAWRLGEWTAGPDNEPMDGTCRAVQELAAYGVSIVLVVGSVLPLILRKRHFAAWLESSPSGSFPPNEAITRPGKAYDRLFD